MSESCLACGVAIAHFENDLLLFVLLNLHNSQQSMGFSTKEASSINFFLLPKWREGEGEGPRCTQKWKWKKGIY